MKRLLELNYNKNVGMNLGLERVTQLAYKLGILDTKVKFVHVAGTNGKGSVSTKIAHGLQHDLGYSVGLFTSPHISTYRERIVEDGKIISEARADLLANEIASAADSLRVQPTYFESLALMAFLEFHLRGVDFAVIEAGLGGRDDATNIIPKPEVAVITSIALDHTEYLGPTIHSIAENKAGIIKQGCTVILGPSVYPKQIFLDRATDLSCPVLFADTPTTDCVNAENTSTAETVLKHIDPKWKGSLQMVRPPCRFETFHLGTSINDTSSSLPGKLRPQSSEDSESACNQNGAVVVLDVAHNPDAFRRLRSDLVGNFGKEKNYTFVIAMSRGKDMQDSLNALLKEESTESSSALRIRSMIFTQGQNEGRAVNPVELVATLGSTGNNAHKSLEYGNNVLVFEDPSDAVRNARSSLDSTSVLVICGTFFLMNKAKEVLGLVDDDHATDSIDMNEQKL